MAELVEDGRTGYRFAPGDASDLITKVRTLLGNPGRLARIRQQVRSEFEHKFTAQSKYAALSSLYSEAMHHSELELSALSQ
jgi:glycosyltransferase involved in cell wall biosynthesis